MFAARHLKGNAMGVYSGAATEIAEEIGRRLFADNAPPADYCGGMWSACL